jgi:hypothetical protein
MRIRASFRRVIFSGIQHKEGQSDLSGDRSSKCAQIDVVLREHVSVVKMIGFRVIFRETDTVFCETDMVVVPGGGNGG